MTSTDLVVSGDSKGGLDLSILIPLWPSLGSGRVVEDSLHENNAVMCQVV